jgi:hypothetical protein
MRINMQSVTHPLTIMSSRPLLIKIVTLLSIVDCPAIACFG